jgi:hypothetical protein
VVRRQRISRRDISSLLWSCKEEQTDEILRGDFTEFCGPLDLAEVQGGFSASVEKD